MYVDPLLEEGLFLLDPDNRPEETPDSELPTEADLPYDFNPDKDYFAEFDKLMPKWQLRPFEKEKGSSAAFFDTRGAPEVKMGRRKTQTVSLRQYVRAIDPAGNLCMLTISTVPPSPDYPTGDDKIGTRSRVIAMKNERGWLVVEREPTFWNAYSGKRGQQYAAWAFAVMKHRKAKHAAHQEAERPQHRTSLDTAINKQTEAMKNLGIEIARSMRAEQLAAARSEVDLGASQLEPAAPPLEPVAPVVLATGRRSKASEKTDG